MGSRTHFQHYDLSKWSKKLRTLNVSKFLGVDFNPAQLQVADNHAVDMENILYKDKVNQKRFGWEQMYKASQDHYFVLNDDGTVTEKVNSDPKINGCWFFVGMDGLRYRVMHVGNILYWVRGIGKNRSFSDFTLTPIVKTVTIGEVEKNISVELQNIKTTAFYGYGRLFIFSGTKMLVLKAQNYSFELKEVEDDEETYIPVTTIGITEADSAVNEQQILDDVNLMTQWRKNKCVSGTYVDDGVSIKKTRFPDYQLDTSILPKKRTDINNINIKISFLKEIA